MAGTSGGPWTAHDGSQVYGGAGSTLVTKKYVWQTIPPALAGRVNRSFHDSLPVRTGRLTDALSSPQNVEWLLNQARYSIWLHTGLYVDVFTPSVLDDLTLVAQAKYTMLQPHDAEPSAIQANLQRINAYILADIRPKMYDLVLSQQWWLRQLQVPVAPPIDYGIYTAKKGEDTPEGNYSFNFIQHTKNFMAT